MGGGGLPEISDCSEQEINKCEVYLVEEIRLEERLKQGRDISISSNFTRGKI
jgi:DNA gyrase/topoisomerase IV subunit B